MDTFEFDSDAFYICTEIAPQNFVVQKAIQIDKSQIERMLGKIDEKGAADPPNPSDHSVGSSSAHSPGRTSPSTLGSSGSSDAPPIPFWFDRECRDRLMMLGPQPQMPPNFSFPSSSNHFGPPVPSPPQTHEDLRLQLKNQLEYYFSRENLISDRYLKCQMDSEHFVPIAVVAGFPKIRRLTDDVDLIVEALKESMIVELDENCEKVRPISKRTTLIIREIPEDRREVVVDLLRNGPQFSELKYGLNDSWYVTFDNELDTQIAYVDVQHKTNEITDRRVCARIKAGGPPTTGSSDTQNGERANAPTPVVNGDSVAQPKLRELGASLNGIGLVPVASYRHGEPILSQFKYQTKTCQFAGNSLGVTTSMPPQPPPPPHSQTLNDQQPPQHFFYQPMVPSTPRNFDEYSTASSNSTHTTTSNYQNRSCSSGVGNGPHHNNTFYESRSSFSNSNEWRGRGGNAPQFQNNYNHKESNGRSNSSRGSWRGRNGTSNTNTLNHQNHRQDVQHNNWRNDQNIPQSNWRNDQNVPQNNWRSEQNGHHQNNQNWRNQQNGHHNNGRNDQKTLPSNQWWLSPNTGNQNRRPYNNNHNNRQNPLVASSSSSNASSKYDAVETTTISEQNASSLSSQSVPRTNQQYTPPTPSEMPPPPVWPAPSFDRRRKSSEASVTTITTATNTLTPSTPVISVDDFPAFSKPEPVVVENTKPKETKEKETKEKKDEPITEKPKKVEPTKMTAVEKEKLRSPSTSAAVAPIPVSTPSFAFEENAFPSLPKKIEPVKPPQKPTFR
ncbi:hypothetical protein L3Y34_015251 [Caenorhabditis briggsae]|uniref:HTH La-type RNA-binding domain-containing protein n=1 Tax=Caenorhabditis briggsae TaxID=6238 RepID=A0AAE9DW40_CAEBR|nr:hypothetical protein L3Y34_015251 [Caenorhabditis briggsae]